MGGQNFLFGFVLTGAPKFKMVIAWYANASADVFAVIERLVMLHSFSKFGTGRRVSGVQY